MDAAPDRTVCPDCGRRTVLRRDGIFRWRACPATKACGWSVFRQADRNEQAPAIEAPAESIEAPAECPHGYPDSCPDCDSPSYLPAVLYRERKQAAAAAAVSALLDSIGADGRPLRAAVDHIGRGSYGV